MKRRRFLAGFAAVPPVAVTGCLSDETAGQDPGDDTDDDISTASPTASPEDSPTDLPDDADTAQSTETPDESSSGIDDVTDTPTDTTDREPSVSDQSLEVIDSSCGQQRDDASVSFDDSAGTVSVTGTIWASDLTYTATLASATIDTDSLVITVATEKKSEGAGGQCITEIDYEARVTLEGSLPSKATVRHRRGDETTTVATADC